MLSINNYIKKFETLESLFIFYKFKIEILQKKLLCCNVNIGVDFFHI